MDKTFVKIYIWNFVIFLTYSLISYVYPLAYLPNVGFLFTIHAVIMLASFVIIFFMIPIEMYKYFKHKQLKKG